MKKIAYLSHSSLGLYNFRLPLMKAASRKGFEVVAISPLDEYTEKIKQSGISHIEWKINRGSLNPLLELKSIVDLYNKLKKNDIDILNTFMLKPNIYGTFIGKIIGIKIIINVVEGMGSFYIDKTIKSLFIKKIIEIFNFFIFRLSTKVIVLNQDDLNFLTKAKIVPHKKIYLLKGVGVNIDEYNPIKIGNEVLNNLKKELQINKDQKIILLVTRLIIHKGVLEFIEAAKILKKKYGNKLVFLIAGDFDYGNHFSISEKILDESIKGNIIKHLGWRNDVKNLLMLSHLFVLPSYREGFPRSAMEAAALGKPIITTDAVGCKEVVDNNQNGIIIPVKDSIALSNAIEKIIFNEKLLKKFGEQSRLKAQIEFDEKIVIKKQIDLYNELLYIENI